MIRKFFLFVIVFILFVLASSSVTLAAELCQFATNATATSENSGSLAIYATGMPNAPKVGKCSGWQNWSGYGYTWSPNNWNVKANLTLKYDSLVNATNFTIFGDYDICWSRMWLKNSKTGTQMQIFSGFDNSCIANRNVSQSFLADTIILQTCGWSWSSTDAVRLCGNQAGCTKDVECSDGKFCNGNERCVNATCIPGTPPTLSDGINCTDDTCDEANDQIIHTSNNTKCDDKLYCNGIEYCNATLGCVAGTPRECSSNNLAEIATCLNNPDNISYTWDFRNLFISTCDENLDTCTTGNATITYTCNITCGAKCDGLNLSGKTCKSFGYEYGNLSCNNCQFDLSNCKNIICGNGLLELGEECDNGIQNGIICTAQYNETCQWCNSQCVLKENKGPFCGDSQKNGPEECDDGNNASNDGCDSKCRNESVYVAPYMGDFDGSISSDWFFFYKQIRQWHDNNNISVGISVYLATMNSQEFNQIVSDIYKSKDIEIVHKSESKVNGTRIDLMPYDEVKAVLVAEQKKFVKELEALSNINVTHPVSYNLQLGRFTETIRNAIHDLGFKIYFEQYVSEYGNIPLLQDLDITQYSVGFTISGKPGYSETYKKPEEIIKEIFSFSDENLVYINGTKVVPLYASQQDFMINESSSGFNQSKWEIYSNVLLRLKNDPRVKLLKPEEIYDLRHPKPPMPVCGNRIIEQGEECDDGNNKSGDGCNSNCNIEKISGEICQFATQANATSENSGSLAIYATGMPNAPKVGMCSSWSDWSGYGYTWSPNNWNVKANLTLKYDIAVNASNFTIFGDYDMCWNKMWLRNSKTGEQLEVFNGFDNSCTLTKQLNGSFLADTVILQTCGWSWSSTDAVRLCGIGVTNQTKNETLNMSNIEICTWKNCKKGAVSVSVDDGYTSCMQELEANGYRGTYFLSDTDRYSQNLWNTFNTAFNKGHEIGTHMRSHFCSQVSNSEYTNDIENNIQDIISHTDIKRTDIITHAHPCGFTTTSIENILKNNWNFLSARGYNYNSLENETPENFFDLKSYNSHGYPGGSLEPPSYFEAVDNAEQEGKWFNLVLHNGCSDDGVIDYLNTKNVWVDSIGNVIKYIKIRDNSSIQNYQKNENLISFYVKSENFSNIYTQNISIRAVTTPKQATGIKINNISIPFQLDYLGNEKIVQFDVPFPIQSNVSIKLI